MRDAGEEEQIFTTVFTEDTEGREERILPFKLWVR
jgi:hypothetical protein